MNQETQTVVVLLEILYTALSGNGYINSLCVKKRASSFDRWDKIKCSGHVQSLEGIVCESLAPVLVSEFCDLTV